jgi:post-segregation antitoxin (ccd killing protein)
MPTYHEIDGVKYRQTTVLIREDLHALAKSEKWNVSALLNKALENKRDGWKE